MSWKSKMRVQVKVASKKKAISRNLKELTECLLKGDSEFQLVYSSGREKYMSIIFNGEVSKKTKAIILSEYGIKVWKLIKPKQYEN